MVTLGREGAVQRNNVRRRQQLVHLDVLAAQLLKVGILIRITPEYVASESAADTGGEESDPARPEEAERLAVEIHPQQTVDREVAVTDTGKCSVEISVEANHESDGVLGHGVGRVGRHSTHCYLPLLSRYQVDVVEAGTSEGHLTDSQLVQLFEHLLVDDVIDERTDHTEPLRKTHSGGREAWFEEGELDVVAEEAQLLRQRRPVVDFGRKDGHLACGCGRHLAGRSQLKEPGCSDGAEGREIGEAPNAWRILVDK
mmetsp:Transcript_35547/g.88346  ORF Transcript_35547/g.88346 Transcript_35547/m.88346 type:complete len:256 (+) Transcript_35547:669-1436(+)